MCFAGPSRNARGAASSTGSSDQSCVCFRYIGNNREGIVMHGAHIHVLLVIQATHPRQHAKSHPLHSSMALQGAHDIV